MTDFKGLIPVHPALLPQMPEFSAEEVRRVDASSAVRRLAGGGDAAPLHFCEFLLAAAGGQPREMLIASRDRVFERRPSAAKATNPDLRILLLRAAALWDAVEVGAPSTILNAVVQFKMTLSDFLKNCSGQGEKSASDRATDVLELLSGRKVIEGRRP